MYFYLLPMKKNVRGDAIGPQKRLKFEMFDNFMN